MITAMKSTHESVYLQRLIPHVNIAYTIFSIKLIYINLLCLNGTHSCVDFMDGIIGHIPLFPHVNTAYFIFSIMLLYITQPYYV